MEFAKLVTMAALNVRLMGSAKLAYHISLLSMKINASTAMNSCGSASAVSTPLFAFSVMTILTSIMENASLTMED